MKASHDKAVPGIGPSLATLTTPATRASSVAARRSVAVLAAVLLAVATGACSSTGSRLPIASSVPPGYEKLPDNLTSKTYRVVLKAIPYTRKRAFHGNYGGSGNVGGIPVDTMDEHFRRHDIVYCTSRSKRQLVAADQALVAAMKELDPATLDPKSLAFRKRVIGFFESPISQIMGKPVGCLFPRQERDGCPFRTAEDVFQFIESDSIPQPGRDSATINLVILSNRRP